MEQDHLVKVQEQVEDWEEVVAKGEWVEIVPALAREATVFALSAEQEFPTL